MNTIKLYRLRSGREREVKRVKVTQSWVNSSWRSTRTVPYVSEVKAWALRNGWSLTKRAARRTA